MKELRISVIATLLIATLVCGVYPFIIWAISQGIFSHKANGSFLSNQGKVIGSELIGQNFTSPNYFHPRPSAANYDGWHSKGSNLGPLSKQLLQDVNKRVKAYREENGISTNVQIPADAVLSSASGLDPHIGLQNALLQATRVANARGLKKEEIVEKIQACTEKRTLKILGMPRVNVLKLNSLLDSQEEEKEKR